jgi:pyruvate/2-oxoglutarate dehydrogenase complex dihydrolipoamide acyltransferase (E2) component
LSFKPIPEDSYGNVFRASAKMSPSGVWIGFGGVKSERLVAKVKGKWEPVNKGDVITVVCSKNGDYLNAKQSDIKLETSAPAAKPASKPALLQPQGDKPKAASAGVQVPGVEVGMALNNAVQAFVHGKIERSDIEAFALEVLGISDRLRTGTAAPAPAEAAAVSEPAKPAKTKKAKSAPPNLHVPEDDNLSDIPEGDGDFDDLEDDLPF